MRNDIAATTLLIGLLSPVSAHSRVGDSPTTVARASAQGDSLASGTRVRLLTAETVEVPGIARLAPKSVQGSGVVVDDAHRIVTVGGAASGSARLTLPQARSTLIGEVIASDENSVLLLLDGHPVEVTIPKGAIAEMWVSVRRVTRTRTQTALRGLGLGVAGGVVLGLLSGDDRCRPGTKVTFLFEQVDSCALTHDSTSGQKAVIFGTLFGALGGIGGLAAGGSQKDDWERVALPSPSKAKVTLRPLGHSGLALRVTF